RSMRATGSWPTATRATGTIVPSRGECSSWASRSDRPAVRVAIVVPSLDQGRFLPEALGSLLAQGGVDLDGGGMDGGSRDDSVAVIHRYEGRLAFWRSGPDGGQAAAVNAGLRRFTSSADVVGWLNADDILLPGALARMAAHLEAHPECVAVFGEA